MAEPLDSIMDMVNNIEPLYLDKEALLERWRDEGDDWEEDAARREAVALAAHFAEAIEASPGWPSERRPEYKPHHFEEAADEMIEEFKEGRE